MAAKIKRVPLRSQVAVEDTWDLAPLYRNDQAWEKAYKALARLVPRFEEFEGRLGRSAKVLRACYDFQVEFEKLAERLGSYAYLKSSEDVANNTYQGMVARFVHLATHASEAASYIAPEIQAIPKKTMDAFLKSPELQPYKFQIKKLLRYKPHILSLAEERLLAMQGEVAESVGKIFGQLNDADLKFGTVVNERGETIELTHSSGRPLLESPKRAVRKETFEKLYAAYESHSNTFAATFHGNVLQDVYHSRARNFPSCIEAALFGDNIPLSVYDSLIEAVHANLDTVYHYLDVRRSALKLKDLHIYDTFVPIVKMDRVKRPYEAGVDMVCAALEPLGDEYVGALRKGLLEGRWVDRFENRNKRSGAFSGGGYFGPPYILMNYQDEVLDSVFTLAHEAGHSMHTHYSAKNQPYQDFQYTIFVAEVASTFNEELLNHYLIERAADKKMRAYLVNREIDEIRGTLIRQTMFAEFEQITHAIAEDGEPLTLERTREEYDKLLALYFGPKFKIDPVLSLECYRIPHFYSAFYVYKYATGIAAAIALSEDVLQGGTAERNRYLSFLKRGGSKYPLDNLRAAGVDMETPQPVARAMSRLKELVVELESLV
jgi:oligoendopeptidase F